MEEIKRLQENHQHPSTISKLFWGVDLGIPRPLGLIGDVVSQLHPAATRGFLASLFPEHFKEIHGSHFTVKGSPLSVKMIREDSDF